MTPFSRREGLQLILGAARAVLLLGATGCRPDPSPTRDDAVTATSDHAPKPGRVSSHARSPFVTISDPSVSHQGVGSRPGYSPSDPRSAAIIDPMSGIEIFRIGGNNGSSVFLDGSQDSGLKFPRKLRQENLGTMRKTFNADSTLLMIDRYFPRSGDPGNAANSYLVDVTGSYTGGPWRIIRAAGKVGLGDGVGQWWVWDTQHPLRAYVFRSDGSVDEWWPVGGAGHSVGEINNLFGPVAGFSFWTGSTRARLHTSWDGQYAMTGCRRDSDGLYGGRRRNLITGALGPFIPTPFPHHDVKRTTAHGISPSGLYTKFSSVNRWRFYNAETGAFVSDTDDVDSAGITHEDWARVDGKDYLLGPRSDDFKMFDVAAGAMHIKGTFFGVNPHHSCAGGYLDLFERYGPAGGSSSGLRYSIYARSNARRGHAKAILGVRLGANDQDVLRFICNHRTVRTDNSDECHPLVSPSGRLVVFNSNWQEPGVETNDDVHPYIALLPEAWYDPNNGGSQSD